MPSNWGPPVTNPTDLWNQRYPGLPMGVPGSGAVTSGVHRMPGMNPGGGSGSVPGVPGVPGAGNPDLGNALGTADQVNQFNLAYYRGAEHDDPIYGVAQRLLNPNDAQANYDVTMHGAELATARGVPGSGLASETTGRIRQRDIERRAELGNQLLNGAHGRVPQPFDVGSQLLTAFQRGQLSLQQAELELRRQVQLGQLSIEQARLLLGQFRGSGSGGGGGGYQPVRLPGGGGGAPSQHGGGIPPWPGETNTGGGVWYDDQGNPHATSDRPDVVDPNDPSQLDYWWNGNSDADDSAQTDDWTDEDWADWYS